MKIFGQPIHDLMKIYNSKNIKIDKRDKEEPIEKSTAPDALALSNESRIKQQAMQAAQQAPDIREDVVKELKEKIAAGTYTIDEGKVAEKMISQAIFDEIV